MTIPVTLNTISNLQDTTTAQTNINANSAAISGGFSTALNVTGDQMKGNLDMNSNQILNLPAPATANSPVRLVDVTSSSSIASVPPVGTSGAVVPLLNTNNTWSGTNTFGTITGTNLPLVNTGQTWTGSNSFSGPVNLTGATLTGIRSRNTAGNYYVNPSTGNDSNPGTLASPFKTMQGGLTYIYNNYDPINGVILNLAAGTYTETLKVAGMPFPGTNEIFITGAGSGSTIWATNSANYNLFVEDIAIVIVSGVTFSNSGGSVGAINCDKMGVCDVFSDVVFGSFPSLAHVTVSNGGTVNLVGPYTISGGAAFHVEVNSGGNVNLSAAVTVSTTANFSTSFVFVRSNGNVALSSPTFTGSSNVSGTRFIMQSGGTILSGSDINTVLPGSISGSYVITGGWDTASGINTLTTLNITPPLKGYFAVVSDATVTTPNTTVTGGGASTVLTWYNGSVWRILGS